MQEQRTLASILHYLIEAYKKLKTEKKVATEKGSRLEFFFRDSIYEVSLVRPSISMGRQKANELIIKDSRVSRVHARAEYRQGKFLIVDQSTNGTYIYIKGDKGQNIKKEEMNLHGSGVIGLGRKVELNSPEAIQFTVFS